MLVVGGADHRVALWPTVDRAVAADRAAGRVDQVAVDQVAVDQVAVGQAVVGQAVVDQAVVDQVAVDRPAVVLRKTATVGERTSSTAPLPNSGHGMWNTGVPWRPAVTNSGCPLGARAEARFAGDCLPHGRHPGAA